MDHNKTKIRSREDLKKKVDLQCTKKTDMKKTVHDGHKVGRVLSFFSSRWIWDSLPAASVPPPSLWFRGGHTRVRERE